MPLSLFIKKRLRHKWFPTNFVKILTTDFKENLRWLRLFGKCFLVFIILVCLSNIKMNHLIAGLDDNHIRAIYCCWHYKSVDTRLIEKKQVIKSQRRCSSIFVDWTFNKSQKLFECLFEKLFFLILNRDLPIGFTTWKVSQYRVISGPYFPAFGLNTER